MYFNRMLVDFNQTSVNFTIFLLDSTWFQVDLDFSVLLASSWIIVICDPGPPLFVSNGISEKYWLYFFEKLRFTLMIKILKLVNPIDRKLIKYWDRISDIRNLCRRFLIFITTKKAVVNFSSRYYLNKKKWVKYYYYGRKNTKYKI